MQWRWFGRVATLVAALAAANLGQDPLSSQNRRGRPFRTVMLDGREVVDGEVLVRMRATPTGAEARADLEAQTEAEEVETIGRRGLRRMRVRRLGTRELMAVARANPEVELVEPNYVIRVATVPNDPNWGSLWGLFNSGQVVSGTAGISGADIGATLAWDITTGSRANVVAIVDTGIDYNHPDLAANMWRAPAAFSVTVGGVVINCAAGTFGFNAINNTCDPMDDNNHGTHVAGTIGAVGNNGKGVVGVNWTASMMGAKFLSATGSGTTANAIKAIDFVIQTKAAFAGSSGANVRVLSNSWGGGGFSTPLLDAITRANASDMLFVAAAGNAASDNDALPSYPASYAAPNIVSVAATDNRDRLASFSNYGRTSVHLGAPGVGILSTIPHGPATCSTCHLASFNGTSMATPHVSGAAALLLSACTLTTAELKNALLSSVDPVPALSTRTTTGGRLNVNRAFLYCRPRVTSVALTSDVASPQPPGAPITFTATPTGGVAPHQYKWMVYNGVAWSMQSWTTSNTFTWTPGATGTYYVGVWVKSDGNSADAAEDPRSVAFTVAGVGASSVGLTANRAAPQPAGTQVIWTASPAGGTAPHQYKWWSFDGVSWTAQSGWSTSNTFAWTPVTANSNYQIRVWVRSDGNAVDAAESMASSAFAVTAAPAGRVTAVALAPDRASPQAAGQIITWTATPTGGTAPYQYKWMVFANGAWTMQAWSASSTFAWTPTAAGSYSIGVWVKSAGNPADAAEVPTSAAYTITSASTVTAVALAPDRAAPQTAGTTMTWTATATGGVNPRQFKFAVFDGASWTAATGWTTASTFVWTPAVANAAYAVRVWARSAGSAADAPEASAMAAFAITGSTRVTAVALSPDRASPQAAGQTITWTATPTGGTAPYQYKWMVFANGAWTMQAWSASSTFVWTPVSSGDYSVGVWVKSAGNPADAAEVPIAAAYTITSVSTVTAVTLTPDRAAPQVAGTAITWTAAATGGANPRQFKFAIFDGISWTAATGWTTASTFAWTPVVPNAAYTVRVWARSAGNAADAPEASAMAAFAITGSTRVTAVALSPDRALPQAAGQTITWTAAPTGGTAPYQYKWMVFANGAWTMQAWSASSTFVWTPASSGAYSVGVWVKSAGNPADAPEVPISAPYTITSVSTVAAVTLTPDRAAPQVAGSTITWTAAATGGVNPRQFKFAIFDGASWTAVTGWTTANTFAWTPGGPNAAYTVRVWARSAGNAADAPEASAMAAFAITGSTRVTAVALTPDRASPQAAGQAITWTAAPTGGIAPYQYKWMVFANGAWTMQAWTASSTFVWTPAAGNYSVGVWVKSAGNPLDAAEYPTAMSYQISASTTVGSVTLTSTLAAPQPPGTTIGWSAAPAGGIGPYQYKWWIYDGTAWAQIAPWSTNATLNWTPPTANPNYSIRVWVRSAGNGVDAAEASAVVPFAIVPSSQLTGVTLTPSLAGPRAPGTTITWTANPIGGTAPLAYKWWIYDGTSWTMATGWTASSTFAWTPAFSGTYYVGIWVKSAGNPADAAEVPFSVIYLVQ